MFSRRSRDTNTHSTNRSPAVGPRTSVPPRSTSFGPIVHIAPPTNYVPALPTLPPLPTLPTIPPIPPLPPLPPLPPNARYQNPFMPTPPPNAPSSRRNPSASTPPTNRVPQPQLAPAQLPQPPYNRAEMPPAPRNTAHPYPVSAQLQSNRVLRYYGDNQDLILVVAWDIVSAGANGVRIMGSDQRHHIIPWHRVYELSADPNDPILNV